MYLAYFAWMVVGVIVALAILGGIIALVREYPHWFAGICCVVVLCCLFACYYNG